MVLYTIYERPADVRVFFYNFPNILTIKGFNMARQIQIRRGTTLENDNFTGAIGEVTMDTDAKTLRVHDGETVGGVALARVSDVMGDYVVEIQLPTADNNYTWYRKYKSGWVEQGGRNDGDRQISAITMPVSMANTNYIVLLSRIVNGIADDPASISLQARNLSETSFEVRQTYAASNTCGLGTGDAYRYNWVVFGLIA